MSSLLMPFQLLEINVISAQDLAPVSRAMRTYAVAWVHPDRKLSTRVDTNGHNNPTWNDKFVFRVDDEFLRADTSAVMIEIYALHWFRDIHVGTIRVLVGNLIPPPSRPHHHQPHVGMRFVALQVRRPSGRPQGILNIGVTLLASSMRSMPLYSQLSTSAVGYRHLMGEEDPHHHHHNNNANQNNNPNSKPQLRRIQSERSERQPGDDEVSQKPGSTINGSEVGAQQKGKLEFDKPLSIISDPEMIMLDPLKWKVITKGKPVSTINGSDLWVDPTKKKMAYEKPISKTNGSDLGAPKKDGVTYGRTNSKFNGLAGTGKHHHFRVPPKVNNTNGSMLSDLGPSPSEVAAAVAEMYPLDEGESVAMEKWSLDGSIEGLRSKLERWRTELPPVYDVGDYGGSSSFRSSGQHQRRHTDGGGGLFSCFGNIYGYECSCICGKGGPARKKKNGSGRVHLSPSVDSASRSFI